MITGAQRAEAESEGTAEISESNAWLNSPDSVYELSSPIEPEMSGKTRALAIVLSVLALAWLAFSVWSLLPTLARPTLQSAVTSIALISGPLILLSLLWLIFGKTPRRETQRFRAVVADMHRESLALQSILEIVARQMEDNHARLTGEAARLMKLGDEASDRLGRVTHYIAKETSTLDRKAEQLEAAANAARVDIGVLLSDLPKAEEQARTVAEAMKQAGLNALGEAGQLESQLSALVARGREADEVVGGTAQRLAAHLSRIENSTAAAKAQLDDATQSMTTAVDDSMARTAEAVDAARSSLQAQGEAMLAMIEQSRAALETAGEESGRNLARRLEEVSGQIEQLAGQLAAQDAASRTLVSGLTQNLAELDQRFAALGATGGAQNETLGASIEELRTRVQALHAEVSGGQDRAAELIGRAQQMATALDGIAGQLRSDLPAALTKVEAQAVRTRNAAEELAPVVEAVQVAACDAAAQAAAAEASIARQNEALNALLTRLRENVAGAEEQLRALGEAAEGADKTAERIGSETGPQLIDALVRVRETANQAAAHARETISAVIPQSASELGEASRQAMSAAIADSVRSQVEELNMLGERASEAARAASERLTRQLLTIGESAAALEARIEEEKRAQEVTSSEAFSRRVSLLIEALNSTAIDVAKILSNDVTDAEWSAYLKGDRGVFTRRAVRLLDNSESREIGRHYEIDAEFREQVNRYVADFEAMLRRVLNDRDGNALGVTLLSSDMGKLYVALAQAIDRLRN